MIDFVIKIYFIGLGMVTKSLFYFNLRKHHSLYGSSMYSSFDNEFEINDSPMELILALNLMKKNLNFLSNLLYQIINLCYLNKQNQMYSSRHFNWNAFNFIDQLNCCFQNLQLQFNFIQLMSSQNIHLLNLFAINNQLNQYFQVFLLNYLNGFPMNQEHTFFNQFLRLGSSKILKLTKYFLKQKLKEFFEQQLYFHYYYKEYLENLFYHSCF